MAVDANACVEDYIQRLVDQGKLDPDNPEHAAAMDALEQNMHTIFDVLLDHLTANAEVTGVKVDSNGDQVGTGSLQ